MCLLESGVESKRHHFPVESGVEFSGVCLCGQCPIVLAGCGHTCGSRVSACCANFTVGQQYRLPPSLMAAGLLLLAQASSAVWTCAGAQHFA